MLSYPTSLTSLARSLVWELAWERGVIRPSPPPPPSQWRSAETPVKRGLKVFDGRLARLSVTLGSGDSRGDITPGPGRRAFG